MAPKELLIPGVLDADQRTDLAANATGRVVRTFVERGQRVAGGALLAQLDTRSAALTRQEADANARSIAEQLASVRADCARNEDLLKKGAISQAEYDRTSAQCRTQAASEEAALARASAATQTIADASIRAPFAGVIAERFARVGDYVRPDSKVVTLLVDDPLRLRLTIPEPMIGFAKEGVTVTFETVSVPNRTFAGVIKYVGREVRATTRDLVDEAVVENKDGALIPGMFVTAHLPIGEAELPVVSKRSLALVDGNTCAFVVVEGRVQQRVVQTGASLGQEIVVLDGIKKGDRIVVDPSKTTDGQLVD
jgi:membrane fusion protein (multidrug efflux system)